MQLVPTPLRRLPRYWRVVDDCFAVLSSTDSDIPSTLFPARHTSAVLCQLPFWHCETVKLAGLTCFGAAAAETTAQDEPMARLRCSSELEHRRWLRALHESGITSPPVSHTHVSPLGSTTRADDTQSVGDSAVSSGEGRSPQPADSGGGSLFARHRLPHTLPRAAERPSRNAFAAVGEAKAQLGENLQQLSELGDTTQEMAGNAGSFAMMAKSRRHSQRLLGCIKVQPSAPTRCS